MNLPQYILYVRRSDRAMQLVDRDTHKVVDIRHVDWTSGIRKIEGVFVSPRSSIGVFLMDDEIQVIDEFPRYLT